MPVDSKLGWLVVLRFYGPVNLMGSCRARSVYLTIRLLGRLNPLSGSKLGRKYLGDLQIENS